MNNYVVHSYSAVDDDKLNLARYESIEIELFCSHPADGTSRHPFVLEDQVRQLDALLSNKSWMEDDNSDADDNDGLMDEIDEDGLMNEINWLTEAEKLLRKELEAAETLEPITIVEERHSSAVTIDKPDETESKDDTSATSTFSVSDSEGDMSVTSSSAQTIVDEDGDTQDDSTVYEDAMEQENVGARKPVFGDAGAILLDAGHTDQQFLDHDLIRCGLDLYIHAGVQNIVSSFFWGQNFIESCGPRRCIAPAVSCKTNSNGMTCATEYPENQNRALGHNDEEGRTHLDSESEESESPPIPKIVQLKRKRSRRSELLHAEIEVTLSSDNNRSMESRFLLQGLSRSKEDIVDQDPVQEVSLAQISVAAAVKLPTVARRRWQFLVFLAFAAAMLKQARVGHYSSPHSPVHAKTEHIKTLPAKISKAMLRQGMHYFPEESCRAFYLTNSYQHSPSLDDSCPSCNESDASAGAVAMTPWHIDPSQESEKISGSSPRSNFFMYDIPRAATVENLPRVLESSEGEWYREKWEYTYVPTFFIF